ncbi:hypothetical protein FV139_00035 [Parahaliea maris]|uniref:Uncharacterized protein n=1 Tax=Parahaliea maris TaxID=2716870 RepID=A0A5C9A8D7_9GAMM|nr:hypothetical protein [Parahaliea maris]TXS95940.1 hypothetical protein FV139_00035 [Parahaliea maris]
MSVSSDRVGTSPYSSAHWFLAGLVALAAAAFYPSWLLHFVQASPLQHMHGLTGAAWLLLLISQSWLARTGYRSGHRWLGRSVLLVAPLFVACGLASIHAMLNSEHPLAVRFGVNIAFMNAIALIAFAGFVGAALRDRARPQRHVRWFACSALLLLTPALSRFIGFWVPGLLMSSLDQYPVNLRLAQGVLLAVLAGLCLHSRWRGAGGEPFVICGVVVFAQQLGFELAGAGSLWGGFTEWYRQLPILIPSLLAAALVVTLLWIAWRRGTPRQA